MFGEMLGMEGGLNNGLVAEFGAEAIDGLGQGGLWGSDGGRAREGGGLEIAERMGGGGVRCR